MRPSYNPYNNEKQRAALQQIEKSTTMQQFLREQDEKLSETHKQYSAIDDPLAIRSLPIKEEPLEFPVESVDEQNKSGSTTCRKEGLLDFIVEIADESSESTTNIESEAERNYRNYLNRLKIMEKVQWNDDYVIYLIEKLRPVPYMWDYKNPVYKNKLKKYQFWQKAVDEINKKFMPSTPFAHGDLVKKWNNLKSYFNAENLKISKAVRSGASAEEIENIQSNWKFRDSLEFLSKNDEPLPSVDNLNKRSLENLQSSECSLSPECTASELNESETASSSEFLCYKKRTISSIQNEELFDNNLSLNRLQPITKINCVEPTTTTATSINQHVQKKAKTCRSLQNETAATTLIEIPNNLTQVISKNFVVKEKTNESSTSGVFRAEKLNQLDAELTVNAKDLIQAIFQNFATKEKSTESSTFGACIAEELDRLDADLKLDAKKRIFNIIIDFQHEQLKRKTK